MKNCSANHYLFWKNKIDKKALLMVLNFKENKLNKKISKVSSNLILKWKTNMKYSSKKIKQIQNIRR